MAPKKTALQPRPRCPECCDWIYAYFLVVCFCLPRRISSKDTYYYYQASAAQEDALKELANAAQVQHAGTREIMMLVSLLCLAVGLGYLCKKALRLKAISVLLAMAAYLEEPLEEEEPWHVVKEIETDEQSRRDVVAERGSQNLQSLRRGRLQIS